MLPISHQIQPEITRIGQLIYFEVNYRYVEQVMKEQKLLKRIYYRKLIFQENIIKRIKKK
ncbi:unnamed protein product [Paramecium octaurelia]|uniref:Uncharacterized protein n=1 Tax=Paramecium octaurelia TaxID=43137 RepID=A0A8S1TTF5_PAROT|nr:unnamed protein product [Paramecium octaurelia]